MQLRLLHLLGALTWSIGQASLDTCVEEDQPALLQFMKTRAGDCTNQPWDCNDGGFSAEAALQVISERPDNRCKGSEISLLNITNGAYTPVCRFNTTCFNSCGIGKDNFIYCRIDDAPTNSLVRITCPVSSSGPTTGSFCWLGEVPLSRAGGFNPRTIGGVDRFYWITIGGSIDVQFYENASAGSNIGVAGLPGWSTATLAQLNNNIGIGSGINIAAQESRLSPAGDLAIREIQNFPGNNDLDWVVSCTEDRVLLQSVEGTTSRFYDLQMVLPVGAAYGLPSGSAGAMWDFKGRIYCAYNNGDGVFEILLDQVSTTQVPVVLASPAESIPITAQNDGMNCFEEETPFPTTTSTTTTTTPAPPEPCENVLYCPLDGTGPRNGLTMTTGPEIDRLNDNRYSFKRICQMAAGSPNLDSCGINDVDGMIYCVAGSGSNQQLVRVTCGSERATNLVCYLGEVPAVNVNGASFAPGTGTFVARNNSDIFTFENVASLSGSTLPVTAPVTQTSTFTMDVESESDLIVQEANVDGSGNKPWIFSCYGRKVFARPLDGSGIQTTLTITGLASIVDANEQARSMWGYSDGSVYCAYLLDNNPYERIVIQVLLDTVNITAGTVEFFEAAPAQGFALSRVNNAEDGLNCLNTASPFPGSGGTTTTTTIPPCEAAAFNCSQYPGPLQVINDDSSASCVSRLQYLNSSGLYTPICSSQPGECQQGCSYNPKDGKIYCQSVRSFRNLGRYFTRIDCDGTTGVMKVCYVDLFRNDVRTASFVEEPFTNFPNYVHSSTPLRNLQADVTTLGAFEDPPFEGVWSGMASEQISSASFNSRSMAISRFDIGDGNGVQTWAIGCNDGQVVVQGVSNDTDNFLENVRYTLTIEEPVPTGGAAKTAWTFENKVYCAYDNAVYFLFTQFITLNTVTNTGTIILGEVSNAATVNNNDDNGGLQCDTPDPFPDVTTSTSTTTTLGPLTACSTQAWNCSNSSNFSTLALQVINEREDGLCVQGTLQALDVETGTYTLICTFPDGECFNGCGVSPLDDQIYCFTEERDQDLAYLTRLSCPTTDIGTGSAGDVCYIGLQRASVSANFDRSGQFVFIADAGGLFVQQDLETLPAYDRRPLPEDNVTFDYRPNATQVNANQPNQIDGFDLTVRAIDLGNATGVQNFTISCNENYVSFQSLTNESAFYKLTMTNINPQGISGAQWEFDGRVFCSYNDEGIVYEILLNTADLQANTIASGIQNPSQVVQSNDGLNCLTAQAPFIDRTTSTTVTTTTSVEATTTSAVATTTSAAASTTSSKKPYYRRFRRFHRFHRFRRIRRRRRNRRYSYKYNASEQKGDEE
ncbi:unnamed protein product [Symbiodinium sp. CCMP2592]|nr:unnamed protein product [Symbiodinium sp. CCMP2592]